MATHSEFETETCDFLIFGSGLAGLSLALKLAPLGHVMVLTKDPHLTSANSSWAQGGIAAVISSDDSFESHINDTMQAGAGLCRRLVVENTVYQAPDRIKDLVKWGVRFDKKPDLEFDLTREGGHSARRILHFEDHTGQEIHKTVLARCLDNPKIQFKTQHFLIDLLGTAQVSGAYIFDSVANRVKSFQSRFTVLATGGAGKVYLYTSNWSGATGDGIAAAFRAGADVANLEFMQFHPTCLYHPNARNFLISEALRGEGGDLINCKGESFMKKYHPMGSLAPRDIVARGIDAEIKKSGQPCVFLRMTHLSRTELESRFPVIFQKCLSLGIDMSVQPIPVVPAAHYLCGGIVTDEKGQTSIPRLFAIGETACTGLHGANRLASNSLLECLTMSHNLAQWLTDKQDQYPLSKTPASPWEYPTEKNDDEMIVIHHMWDEIRTLMWNYVGIVRSNKRLERAHHRLQNILAEVRDYYSNFSIHPDILELRNIALVADLTIQCALQRHESRGIHFNLDFPETLPAGKDTVISPHRKV